ncbi:YdeI family protein [uncultured Winogradskyella sp.]|uniref:YdeI/OmpD-associated family protein n=1 Tax=uncultured Winogradskyella sp. TaxID=395353 RepID=UPI0026163B1C|nr:YdeI/OmpD-associated family protein [uncultured Winogradskyella sp.]
MKKVYSVEEYIETNSHWQDALELLRSIVLKTELNEAVKWSAPVYDLNGKNVLGLGAFKHHFCIWFFNGVFLKDEHKLLVNAQEGKTKGLRQMRFDKIEDVNKDQVLAYVKEAIENQRAGKEIKIERKGKTVVIPEELKAALSNDQDLQLTFEALTPGKQREYCEHIASAKREVTKLSRLEKIIPMILNGVGLHDKYKNC